MSEKEKVIECIKEIRPCNDSSGMFFIDCVFNPRSEENK